jgi:ABC-type lipoprotein export system ATPase subunit
MGACHAIIVGPTRSGKTTFLAIIGARAISAGFRVIYILRFRVLRATDFKIFEKTHAALINIKNFE